MNPNPCTKRPPIWMWGSSLEQRIRLLKRGSCFIARTKDPSSGKTVKRSKGDLQRRAPRAPLAHVP